MFGLTLSYELLLLCIAGLVAALAAVIRRRPQVAGSPAMLALMAAVVVWVLAYAGELAAPSLAAKTLFAKIQYLGIVAVPPLWVVFALQYTHTAHWPARRLALLAAIPAATLLLVWSNELHGFHWRSVALEPPGSAPALVVAYGPWFWVHTAYAYACLAAGSWLLGRATLQSHHLYRWQGGTLLLAVALVWASNAAYLAGLWPLAPLDPSPLAFGISTLIMGWCVLRFRLLDIAPVAPRAVIGKMRDGVLVLDRHGRVVELNPAAANALGCTADAALGEPAERLPAAAAILAAYQAGQTSRSELTLGPPADPCSYEVSVAPLADRHGAPAGTLVLLHDVSERKRAEAAAATAARARSEFLAHLSHEVRTPLNSVLGAASLLLATRPSDEQRRLVELIQSGGGALLATLSRLLDFAQLESGRLELELAPFELRRCVEEALDGVRARATARGLALELAVADGTPAVLVGDQGRLRQILAALLDNAVAFTAENAVQVAVSARTCDDGRVEARFAVRDVGPGFATEQSDDPFQPPAGDDGTAAQRHAGLGLALCRRLCELLGGAIWLEGEPGQGATVVFTVVAERPPDGVSFHLPGWTTPLQGWRVLIIGGPAAMRHALELQLRAWGAHPWATGSGDEALSRVRQGEPFDVALLAGPPDDLEAHALLPALRAERPAGELPLVLLAYPGLDLDAYHAGAGLVQAMLPRSTRMAQLYAVLCTLADPEPAGEVGPPPEQLPVLLVEDDRTNQVLAEHLLRRLGYSVQVVESGPLALAALERERYQAVLLDVQMPGMDGLAVARAITRRWTRARRPPLIALTANVLLGEREQCLAAGMDDYLSKPISLESLRQTLARHSAGARRESSPGAGPFDAALARAQFQQLGQAAFAAMVGAYIADAAELLAEMDAAVESGANTRLAALAHKLKSSSAILAARRLSALCAELEAAAPQAPAAELRKRLDAIRAEYAAVAAALGVGSAAADAGRP